MVLMVIALVGISMVGTARRVLAAGQAARDAQSDLQRRWGIISLQNVVLENAPKLLDTGKPNLAIDLGGMTFEAHLADEGAKLPVGALIAERGKEQAERTVRDLIRKKGSLAEVRLDIWSPPPAKGEKRKPGVQSLGQVFPASTPQDWLALSRWVTAWGDGGLNARRAPADVIAARCGPLLPAGQVTALKTFLATDPKMKIDDALAQLSLTDEAREKLDGKLVDSTGCYSAWIIATDTRRQWHRFAVKAEHETSTAITAFDW